MKKKILAMAVVMICLSVLASTTLAYFTDTGTARNVITAGGIDVEVVEQQLVDGSVQPYPEEPIAIMPGSTVSKIVSVAGNAQPAWVRVAWTVTVLDPRGEPKEIPAEELEKLVIIRPNAESWTLKDGWWYYSAAVASGEQSEPIFSQVSFSGPNMGNEYQNCTVLIAVQAQAVQQANNGATALEALGWPEPAQE